MKFEHVPPQIPSETPTKIAFVGEAPSDEELEKGQPLVGPSGRVFNQMLATANLDRSEYLITNVFDEQLPDNDVKDWCVRNPEAFKLGLTNLPPLGEAGFLKEEHRWHLERLKHELETYRPNIIVPLGGTALWAFTGDMGISAQRGSLRTASRLLPGAKLLPTFHPAHVIHQWKYFSIVVSDFLKAQIEGEKGPEYVPPNRYLIVEPTLNDIREEMPRLLTSPLLSVDIETGWGQITNIGFAGSVERAINIPFVDRRQPSRSYWRTPTEELEAWSLVRAIMEAPVPKLGQNFGGYDAAWFIRKVGIQPRNFLHDTRLMHHALFPELPKDLEFMGASYANQGAWKYWARKKKEKKDD